MDSTGPWDEESQGGAKLEPEPLRRVEVFVRPRTVATVLLVAAAFLVVGYALTQVTRVLVWLLAGLFVALAFDPLLRRLQDRGLPRWAAFLVVIFGVVGVVAGVLLVLLPPLGEQATQLAGDAPVLLAQLREFAFIAWLDDRFDMVGQMSQWAAGLPERAAGDLTRIAGGIISSVIGLLAILAIGFLMLFNGEGMVRGMLVLFPSLADERRWQVIKRAYGGVSSYIFGTMTVAIIDGLVVLVLLLILGVPLPLPLALWVTLTAWIPALGATLGALPAVIVAAVDEPWKGLVVIVGVIIYQQFESIVLQPAIVGRVVHVSPLVVFVAFLLGAQLLGIVGALLAVPVAGTIQIAIRQEVERRRTEHPQRVEQALDRLEPNNGSVDE
jgi:predicted PurR-regulated permease PerM